MSIDFLKKRGGAPTSMFNDTSINLTARQLMNKRYPVPNPDRYAVIAYIPDDVKGSSKFFVRIFGLHPTMKAAEENVREAMSSGYVYFDLIIADTRSWLPFPPEKFETEKQGDEILEGLFSKKIKDSKQEVVDLKKRVRDAKPTTPFESYKDFVVKEAKKLILAMEKNDKNYIKKLEDDFKIYQDMAQKKSDDEFRKTAESVDFQALTQG